MEEGSSSTENMETDYFDSVEQSPKWTSLSGQLQSTDGKCLSEIQGFTMPTSIMQSLQIDSTPSGVAGTSPTFSNMSGQTAGNSFRLLNTADLVTSDSGDLQQCTTLTKKTDDFHTEQLEGNDEDLGQEGKLDTLKSLSTVSTRTQYIADKSDTSIIKTGTQAVSPRRRTRQSRTLSSSGAGNQVARAENSTSISTSPHQGCTELKDSSNNSNLSFKPPLLEEILNEKKVALMRSPEVMKFLQAQQKNVSREKQFTSNFHSSNTNNS